MVRAAIGDGDGESQNTKNEEISLNLIRIFIIEGIWSIVLSIVILLVFPGKSFIELQDKLVIDDPYEILTLKTFISGIRDTCKNKFIWLM